MSGNESVTECGPCTAGPVAWRDGIPVHTPECGQVLECACCQDTRNERSAPVAPVSHAPFLVTKHTEDHTSASGRVRSQCVTTCWHFPVTLDEAIESTIGRHPEGNPRNFRIVSDSETAVS